MGHSREKIGHLHTMLRLTPLTAVRFLPPSEFADMAKVTFYPLGNADCCLIEVNSRLFVFDYADKRNADDPDDKRIDLKQAFQEDIGFPKRKYVDVLAFTHGDDDHVRKTPEVFWLEHATKYQGPDRIKANEMWVPAAMIVEEGSEDDTKILRAEARHRFLNKKGIRVFSRPERLRTWLSERGLKLEDYRHLITDAGQVVPSYNVTEHDIEFFVHSPFALRENGGILDRNENCIVMQAVIRAGGRDTRFLITADSTSEPWQKMVKITRGHGNDHRLAWDIFKIPHHCSYLSMSDEKGSDKTTPTEEFKWLLEQGTTRSVMISSSCEIPAETTDQPPHVETYRRYSETRDDLDAELVVTMENPTKTQPKRTVITIDGNGPTLTKEAFGAGIAITTTRSPRVG